MSMFFSSAVETLLRVFFSTAGKTLLKVFFSTAGVNLLRVFFSTTSTSSYLWKVFFVSLSFSSLMFFPSS